MSESLSLCTYDVELGMHWATLISYVGVNSDNVFIATPDSLLSERLVRGKPATDVAELELDGMPSFIGMNV